ncbi:MAG: carbohydrate-binding domain-containing protein [Lachnospiraceae bacterium]|nr:carbohydrate-binding domain-containing protein [Lachnospiraceae bacterium]
MKQLLFIRKKLALLLSFSLLAALIPTSAFAADDTDTASAVALSAETTFVFDGDSVTVTDGSDTNYEVVIYDSTDTETAAATSTDSNGNTVYSVPSGSSGQLLVSIKKAGGSYVFSGSGNGSIAVKKEATGDSTLYLNGLTLTSAFTSVITVKKDSSASCTIYAVVGTVNTLTDNAYNNDETYTSNAAAENAVLKFKDGSDVTIAGSGTINLYGNGKNGIKANNNLTIRNVTLNISALNNGISSENTINITSGTISITTTEGDGIKACADDSATGSITISGGTFTINSCADGIQAMMNLTISGGTFSITTYGGYSATYDKDDDSYPSAKGLKASGSYEDTSGNEIDATGCTLSISGGSFSLNTADDSVHSDGAVTITGGSFSIYTGDDAIQADGALTAGSSGGSESSPAITINTCYEGLEGAIVNIYSGKHVIYSTDDCINAANSDLSNYAFQLNIYGGNIYAASIANDCLDSNGNLTISGGTVIALGGLDNTSEVSNSLDCDGTLTISGGTVLAIGMYEMMSQPSSGSQAYVAWSAAGNATAGTGSGGQYTPSTGTEQGAPDSGNTMNPDGNTSGQTTPNQDQGTMPDQGTTPNGSTGSGLVSNGDSLVIYDSNGNALFSATANWNAGSSYSGNSVDYVLYSSSSLTSGSTYNLVLNGVDTTVPETEAATEAETETEDSSEAETETETETESETENTTESGSDTSANGTLALGDDGNWYYYVDGEIDTTFSGIATYDGGMFFVVEGQVVSGANGLNLYNNVWYFLANGQVQTQYTGLVEYDGAWFFITSGILDTSKIGLVAYDGETFLVADGQLLVDYNGLWQNASSIGGDDKWYFLAAGKVQNVSQVVMYDGEWFVVENGVLASDYNGTIEYDGATFTVVAGQLYS